MTRLPWLIIPALALTACPGPTPQDAGPPDAGPEDAGSADAGPDAGAPADAGPDDDGGVQLVDWLGVRGPALPATAEAELPGRAFALSDTTWAIESDCDAGTCTLSWYGDGGVLLQRHQRLAPVATDPFSTDGTKFAAVEVDAGFLCVSPNLTVQLVEGTWGLYDAQSGDRLVSYGPTLVEPTLIYSPFTRWGTLVRRDRSDRATCGQIESTPLLTTPPYGVPEVLAAIPSDPSAPPWVEDDTSDGQLIVVSQAGLTSPLGIARPRDPSSYLPIDADYREYFVTSGFLHVLGAYPFQRLSTLRLPGRARHDAQLASTEIDFVAAAASGRWAVACSLRLVGGRRCDAHDGLGERPTRTFRSDGLPAVAGGVELALYTAVDGGIVQLDLTTGSSQRVGVPATRARVVGLGGGLLLEDVDRVWGLQRGLPFRIGERKREVYTGATQVEQPQSQIVFVVSSNASGSLTYLDIWNVEQRKVVRVTDNLFFNPPFMLPFTADETCSAPGFLRSLGPPSTSAAQPGRWLHFTEFVPAAQPKIRVHVLPADLSAPPRLIAELDPDQCSPPLVSPSGRRVMLPVRTGNGITRAVLSPL